MSASMSATLSKYYGPRMRIAMVNWPSRKAGGAEIYLSRVIGALRQAGNEIALLFEVDAPEDREPIGLPADSAAWCVSKVGWKRALAALGEWRPDVIYV